MAFQSIFSLPVTLFAHEITVIDSSDGCFTKGSNMDIRCVMTLLHFIYLLLPSFTILSSRASRCAVERVTPDAICTRSTTIVEDWHDRHV